MKELLADRAAVVQSDRDECEADADAAGVNVVPTFIVVKDGKEMWRKSGEVAADDLMSAVEKYL